SSLLAPHSSLFSPHSSRLTSYMELTKPGITLAVLITTLAGFLLAKQPNIPPDWPLLIHTLLGTALVSAGAGVLNMLLEVESDSIMHRTRNRPLPAGRVLPQEAFILGIVLSAAGLVHLSATTYPPAGFLAAISLTLYLLVYTPLKLKTPFCSAVGAVSGAIPPLIGWTAAQGSLGWEAFTLFLILFLWQFPHLLALGWMYREDYQSAGIHMLPPHDENGTRTSKQALILSLALVVASLLPIPLGMTKNFYTYGAFILSSLFLLAAFRFYFSPSKDSAKTLFLTSIFYNPALLIVLTLCR
ncbi:MAG: protoheme IX farnesyltransferase, partial [Elusimicrobia bacterium]|nr:protoheme IX farnesyltransferase [Elusimicrobiota bacterium]